MNPLYYDCFVLLGMGENKIPRTKIKTYSVQGVSNQDVNQILKKLEFLKCENAELVFGTYK